VSRFLEEAERRSLIHVCVCVTRRTSINNTVDPFVSYLINLIYFHILLLKLDLYRCLSDENCPLIFNIRSTELRLKLLLSELQGLII